jgi:hypothetical protein
MTTRREILAQQDAKLSLTINLDPGESLIGRAVRMQVRKFPGDTVVQIVASSTDERLLVTGARQLQLEVGSLVMAALLVTENIELWSFDIQSYTNADNRVREAEGVFKISKSTTRDTEVEPAPTVAGFLSLTIPQEWTAEQQAIGQNNLGVTGGGSSAPLQLATFTVATLPAATAGRLIYVSDESGGSVVAFSDGTNWRRLTDRAIVT